MKNTSQLGRTIADLMKENAIEFNDNEEVVEIDVDKIKSNPQQPRLVFDDKKLEDLASSIKVHGVMQPIIIKPSVNGYVLVAGERRLRASKLLGKKTIPSIVRDYNSKYLAELALLENLQRENLNPIEEATAYRLLLKRSNLSHAELAEKIGLSRSHVTNMLGLFNLSEDIIKLLKEEKLSMGHARVLSKIKDESKVETLAKRVIEESLSVRDLERISKEVPSKTLESDLENQKLNNVLKTQFSINAKSKVKNKRIEIVFKKKEDLDKFLDKLVGFSNE